MPEIATILSQKWRNLGAAEKQVYEDKAAEEKRIYIEKLTAYKATAQYSAFQNKLKEWKGAQNVFVARSEAKK